MGSRCSVDAYRRYRAHHCASESKLLLDGLKLFSLDVRGKSVLLKPNLVEDLPGPLNTNPVLIGAAARCFLRLGAGRVVIGEGPGHQRDTELVLDAAVQVESAWQPGVVSPKGAIGLMQLMPATARQFGATHPFQVDENVRGGVAYLAELIRVFRGDLRLVTAV
jgi:hypothetical protein